jgi:hypothetical protein
VNPIECKVSVKCARHAAPLVFNPYNALTITTGLPFCAAPNSSPAIKYTFSLTSALI